MRMIYAIVALIVVAGNISTPLQADSKLLEEASGITRAGDHLLIVSDATPGTYYWYRLNDDDCRGGQRVCVIALDPSRVQRVEIPGASLARDLEGVGILGDGRVAMLSERLRSLITDSGAIAEYSEQVSEFAERGLEGLAILPLGDGASRIAALWEGGYLQMDEVPPAVSTPLGAVALKPRVVVHDVAAGAAAAEVDVSRSSVELQVPLPAGTEPSAQRFRAPDLVWHEWMEGTERKSGFIVLISSQSSTKPVVYQNEWLMRFDLNGKPLPGSIDLGTLLPDELGKANWEGLGWFVPGESVVLIHDKPPKGVPKVVVVALPDEWRGAPARPMIVREDTPYYKSGPQQGRPPDGTARKGSVVQLLSAGGSYSQVNVDNDSAYVSSSALASLRSGAAGDGSKFVRVIDGVLTVDWAYSEGPGWIAVYTDDGSGSPANFIGVAPLRPGWNETIPVPVNLRGQSKVWVVYYEDRGKAGAFEPASAVRWRGAAMCDAADVPATLCDRRKLASTRLVDVCAGSSFGDCREGLPIGVFMLTATP